MVVKTNTSESRTQWLESQLVATVTVGYESYRWPVGGGFQRSRTTT